MMMPSLRNHFFRGYADPFDDLFDLSKDFFDGADHKAMKTDVKEVDGNYELEMELPGFKKEEINAKLENGYLSIQAEHKEEKDKKDKKGNYIRRERYQGSVSRSFYVGDSVKKDDLKAHFENGVLHLTLPKPELAQPSQDNYISIEG